MKEQIKQLRVEIDGLAQLCEGLKPIKDGAAIHNRLKGLELLSIHSTESERAAHKARYRKEYDQVIRETSKNTDEIKEAVKSLKLSKAWLGKVLESLGSENPYKSGCKTVEDIEPAVDEHRGVLHDPQEGEKPWLTKSHVEKVDWLRTEIRQLANIVLEINGGKLNQRSYSEYQEKLQWNAYSYLQEARFWLGFELGRIRDESN